jgi:hypothetical protein
VLRCTSSRLPQAAPSSPVASSPADEDVVDAEIIDEDEQK